MNFISLSKILALAFFCGPFSFVNAVELIKHEPEIGNSNLANRLIRKAEFLELHHHPVWKKLLVYNHSEKPQSYVISPEFFLSANGSRNPLAELRATISALTAEVGENPNMHAQCTFRGRYLWLSSMLNLKSENFYRVDCPDFQKWSYGENTSSVSLVYATGYLGNPASYYGHVLLKIDSNADTQTPLEDQTINFGAIIPDNEGMVAYILKGLSGGYESGFTHREYFFHTHNYGENDLRDLWEYTLDLSSEERSFVIAHAWELLGKKYQYYFLNRNCAFHMAELLELVTGVEVVPRFPLWAIPQTFLQNLGKSQRNGKPFILSTKYLPSRQSRLYAKFDVLSDQEKNIVRVIAEKPSAIENFNFSSIDQYSQKRILQTLIDYFKYLLEKDEEQDEIKHAYNQTLGHLFKLDPGNSFKQLIEPKSPHLSRKPSYASLRGSYNSSSNGSTFLRIRPAYYDNLDSGAGHVIHSALSMADLELEINQNSLKLNELKFVHIENLSSKSTGLPGDASDYWSLTAQLKRDSLECESCLVPVLSARKGLSYSASSDFTLAGYAGAGLQESTGDSENVFGELGVIAVIDLTEKLNFEARANFQQFIDGDSSNKKWVTSIKSRYAISQDLDIRFGYKKDLAREYFVSIGWYW